ncbi:MAG: matrixin family metalloprotease [Dehalococcoidia bacterium]
MRIVFALMSLSALAWGVAAYAYAGTTQAHAESADGFRDMDTVFMVPQDGQWYYVKVEFFMYDKGDGTFADDVASAQAEMISRFPGAVPMTGGEVNAAFVTSGFKWTSGTTSWSYNGTDAAASVAGSANAALQAAASTWGQQGAAFNFTGGGSTSNGTGACGGGTDGSNTVGWAPQSGSVLAVTCSWFGSSGNPFKPAVEFDMQIDPEWNWTTGSPIQVDLQSVALHEFGHALGLNHSGSSAAVMYASYTSGTNKRTPDSDDVNGILAIYGPTGGGPTNTPTNTPSPTNTPQASPSSTTTPGASTTPTRTPTPGGSPTQPLPTSTPTKTPTPGGNGGPNPTPPPLPTSTPTKTPSPGASPSVSPTATFTPTLTPKPSATATPVPNAPSLPIVPGANFLAWPGNDLPPAVALAGVPNLKIVYSYDPSTGNWSRYIPGAPAYVNNLLSLKKGGAYWFIATGSAQITFQP